MLEIYLKTIGDIKTAVLSLIEKERNAGADWQNKTQSPLSQTEFALSETDRFFEQVISLPGDSEELYRCRHLMIEALEDLRESFENRYSAEVSGSSSGAYWQVKRAGYLMKLQAALQEVRKLLS
ncbi:MAG TPA: hypothetical protein VNT57_03340 [Desulfobacteria bacterium]|nr:hypothetical protein [Desulfobacteria bacterium]